MSKPQMFETNEQYVTPYLPAEAHEHAREWKRRGNTNVVLQRVLSALRVEMEDGTLITARCQNCQDVGFVYVSFCRAGPFRYAPGHKRGEVITWYDGDPLETGWYIVVKTQEYTCPHCKGKPMEFDPAEAERVRQEKLPWYHDA